MNREQTIRAIIEDAIPLDMTCAVKRSEQLAKRAKLRLGIEELLRTTPAQPTVGPSQIKT